MRITVWNRSSMWLRGVRVMRHRRRCRARVHLVRIERRRSCLPRDVRVRSWPIVPVGGVSRAVRARARPLRSGQLFGLRKGAFGRWRVGFTRCVLGRLRLRRRGLVRFSTWGPRWGSLCVPSRARSRGVHECSQRAAPEWCLRGRRGVRRGPRLRRHFDGLFVVPEALQARRSGRVWRLWGIPCFACGRRRHVRILPMTIQRATR